jgi:hypothetical protein
LLLTPVDTCSKFAAVLLTPAQIVKKLCS